MPKKLEVCYLEGSFPIERHGAWYDLALPQDLSMKSGESKLVPFNLCIAMPEGYEGILVPRSSTFKKFGLIQANMVGVFENDYCGIDDIWGTYLLATRDVEVPRGTRISQFRIQKSMPDLKIKAVAPGEWTYDNRGGWGSTGNMTESFLGGPVVDKKLNEAIEEATASMVSGD